MKECVTGVEDEEFLCGVLSYCPSLTRYAVERAYNADVTSIKICRDIIDQVMGKLIQFDFRNGLIRRKYDSLKYSLKSMEDLLYEMSLVHKSIEEEEDEKEPLFITED